MSKLFNKQNFNAAKEFVSTIKNKLNKKKGQPITATLEKKTQLCPYGKTKILY